MGQPLRVAWNYKYERLWQDTPEDQELMAIYSACGLNYIPGQAKVADQDLILVPEGTEGLKTVTLTDGSTRTFLDNGFGTIDIEDKKVLGSFSPDWVGGMNIALTYKNWELNSFIYSRMGNIYFGRLQTYGRRVEKDVWSPENPGGKYPQPTTAAHNSLNYAMNYTKANMVIVRNIALSYTVPD